MKRIPNLFIVGAARAGTTSLSKYLSKSPSIFLPTIKEPKYLCLESHLLAMRGLGDSEVMEGKPRSLEEYQSLYTDLECKYALDASTSYLYYYKSAIESMKTHCDDEPRIIIILRNPVDRAYSQYNLKHRQGYETLPFDEALDAERERIDLGWSYGWHYSQVGFYAEAVTQYMAEFNRVHIVILEELLRDFKAEVCRLESFLSCRLPEGEIGRSNSGLVRYPSSMLKLKTILGGAGLYNNIPSGLRGPIKSLFGRQVESSGIKDMAESLENHLYTLYGEDIEKVTEIIGRIPFGWRRF